MTRRLLPAGYEEKFASFITMIHEAKQAGLDGVIVAEPRVLGDDYGELVESLSRLADAGLVLHITHRAG